MDELVDRWDGQSKGLPVPDEGCCYCASSMNTPDPELAAIPMRQLTGFCKLGKPRTNSWAEPSYDKSKEES